MRILVVAAGLLLALAGSARAEEDALEVGRQLLGGEENERAIKLLEQVIAEGAKGPPDAARLLRAGRAHFYLEHDAEALAAYEKAAALDPKNGDVAYWQGLVFVYQEDGETKALAALQRAVAVDPQHGRAWFELGRLHTRRKEPKDSLAAHERAAKLLPDDARAHYLLAVQLEEAGRSADARKPLERALELQPDYVDAGYNLGLNHYLAGRFEPARDVWVRMAEHAPDDFALHAKIVQAYYALGKYAEAGTWRERVRKIHETSEDEETRAKKDFCFDQFVVDDVRVYAYERFAPQPTKEEPIGYLYLFHVQKDGKTLRKVQVEVSQIAIELGAAPYLLCAVVGDEHRTYQLAWREPPAYPELKAAVLKAMKDELPVAASSRKGSVTVKPSGR